jgi:uncharacterized protein (TIGR03435 family)
MRHIIFLSALFGIALAQSEQPARLSFELASIRPHSGPLGHIADFHISGPRVVYGGYNPFLLIVEAYSIRNYQISASEKLPLYDYYDIAANAPRSVTHDESRLMLQALLADRFKLRVRRETRDMLVYELVLDKKGSLLKPGSGDSACASSIGPVRPADRNYRYQFTNCTLAPLVDALQADRPIVDNTGLAGRYDITLFATPAMKIHDSSEPGDIELSDAIHQLGLKLQARKAPTEILVVDRIEKPSEN